MGLPKLKLRLLFLNNPTYMKNTLGVAFMLCTFLSVQSSWSQSKKETQQVKEQMWGLDDPAFAVTKTPEKWNKESVIVIAKSTNYEFSTYSKNFYFRERIKILDKNALEKFSKFSFSKHVQENKVRSKDKLKFFFGIKVIKQDQKTQEVNLQKEAIKISYGKIKYSKIAIPNLEIGDILDYYLCIKYKYKYGYQHLFNYYLADQVPILYQKVKINIINTYEMRQASLNGAPKLSLNKPLIGNGIYTLVHRNQQAIKSTHWIYYQRIIPFIRCYISRSYSRYIKRPKTRALSKKRKDLLKSFSSWHKKKYQISPFFSPKEVLPKRIYYFLRWWHLERNIFNTIDTENNLNSEEVNDNNAYNDFKSLFNQFKIDARLVKSLPRFYGDINHYIAGDHIYSLQIEDRFYNLPLSYNSNRLFAEIHPQVQGTANQHLTHLNQWANRNNLDSIPISPYDHNKTSVKIGFNLINNGSLNIDRQFTISGESKHSYQSDILTKLDIANSALIPNHPNLVASKKKFDAQEANQERLKRVKRIIENEYDHKIEKVESFELVQPGRTEKHPNLIFKDAFTLNAFVKKVGPNYIIEAGKLIGGQVEVKENERKRQYDIYMDYPRNFEYTINFQIPDGYEAKGVDKFNFKVENETGGFISSATKEDNKITIKSRKFYKHNFEKAEDWGKMVKFLDAAYQFTQQKLLLKPSSK